MALFRIELKFQIVAYKLSWCDRPLEVGEAAELFMKDPDHRFDYTRRPIVIIKDDGMEHDGLNRQVIIKFTKHDDGYEHLARRHRIYPSSSSIPIRGLFTVDGPSKYRSFIDHQLFKTTFTKDQQQVKAVPLTPKYDQSPLYAIGRQFWVYKDVVFSTPEMFTPEEMTAVILDSERRKRQRVERAMNKSAASPGNQLRRRPIPDEVKMFVWRRDDGRCVKCGSNQKLEFDHIIPHSMGGADTARNLQLLCETCNRSKGPSI